MACEGGDQDLRHVGQIGAEVVEDLLERRDDLDHDEDQDADGEGNDRHRVDQRPFDFALQRLGTFLELGQSLEDDFQGPARLAGLDHVDVEPVERFGRFGHRLGKRGSAFDFVANVDQAVLQRAGLGLHFENFQAAEDRQAGVLKDRKLAGERGQVLGIDAADGERLSFLAGFLLFRGALACLFDGDLRNEVPHLPDRCLRFLLGRRFDDVLDFLPAGIHRFELKRRHGLVLTKLAEAPTSRRRLNGFQVLPLPSGEGRSEGAVHG